MPGCLPPPYACAIFAAGASQPDVMMWSAVLMAVFMLAIVVAQLGRIEKQLDRVLDQLRLSTEIEEPQPPGTGLPRDDA